jgi:hypothetical protein
LSNPNPIAPTTISGRIWASRRLFQPILHTRAASALIGRSGPAWRRKAAIDAEVVTVSVVDAAPPEGVTVCGKKLHVAPEGRPEQLKETAESNPFSGVTEIEVVPLCPAVMVNDAGEAATEKLGGIVSITIRLL